jgi:predicted TIM-barrel fold metal-dependent hydrolase
MIIDINMHWLPENLFTDESLLDSLIRMVPRAYGEYARLDTVPGTSKVQIVIEKPKGYQNLNFTELDTNTTKRLAAMDAANVDKAILRIPCWEEWLDLEIAKKLNDLLAKSVKEHPDRFLGLAMVPPWGDKECLKEVERCIKDLGCCGVEMAAHYGDLYLDEEEFRPYFKKLSQLEVPVVVHHTPLPVDYGSLYKYTNVRRGFGRIVDQLTSLGRVLHSGLLDEFPNLEIIYSYLAGGFFAFTSMIAVKKSVMPEEMERSDTELAEKIQGYLERNIYFDMCHAPPWGKDHLEFAVKVLGADHVLYGSSYPVKLEWCAKGVEFVKNLSIDEKEKSLILGGNAMRLFNIKV